MNTGNKNQEHKKKDKDKEVQLTSTNVNKTCGHCHKKGYICKDCPKWKKKLGKTKCIECRKIGHTDANYWESYPEKARQWYKDMQKGKETSRTGVDDTTNDEQDFAQAWL